jgi:hypothetical protein
MPSNRPLSDTLSHHKAGRSELSGSGTQMLMSLRRRRRRRSKKRKRRRRQSQKNNMQRAVKQH